MSNNNQDYCRPCCHDEKIKMVENMERYGGGFVQALALCFIKADIDNLGRLYAAFPEIVHKYFTLKNDNVDQ